MPWAVLPRAAAGACAGMRLHRGVDAQLPVPPAARTQCCMRTCMPVVHGFVTAGRFAVRIAQKLLDSGFPKNDNTSL